MLKQLVVNADDFGFTPDVNQGIVEAHRNGILTATTVNHGSTIAAKISVPATTWNFPKPLRNAPCRVFLTAQPPLPQELAE